MPTKFTGVHRAHAAFATRSRSFSSGTSAAAPLKPTAPADEPPPGAAISPARQSLPLDLQAKLDMPAAQPTRPPVILPGGLDLRLSHGELPAPTLMEPRSAEQTWPELMWPESFDHNGGSTTDDCS